MKYVCCTATVVFMLMGMGALADEKGLVCPDKPRNDTKARNLAGTLFGEAEEAFEAGNYERSLETFLCSMRMVEHPNTVINIEKTVAKLQDKQFVLALLRRYIEWVPNGKETPKIEAMADEIGKTMSHEADCECPTPEPVKPVCPKLDVSACERAEIDVRRTQHILSIAGWTNVGVGAAAFITAIVLQGLAGSKKNRAQNADTYTAFLEAKDDRKGLQTSATTLFVTSGLLAGTGFLHLFLLSRKGEYHMSGGTESPKKKPKKATVSLLTGTTFWGIEGSF